MSRRGTFNRRGHVKGLAGPPPTFMPPEILMYFEPPPPLEYKPPVERKDHPPITGAVNFLDMFEEEAAPERVSLETPKQRHERLRKESVHRNQERIQEEIQYWNPEKNEKATQDAYQTLFIGRLAFETDEQRLKNVMERFGRVRSVKITRDLEGKSRGYGFVEFEDENDMRQAYKRADGLSLDGRSIVVDVERGRTVRGWKPRKFGGGLGETRKGTKKESKVYRGRVALGTIAEIEAKNRRQVKAPSAFINSTPHQDHYSRRGYYGRSDRGSDRVYRTRGGRSRSRERLSRDRSRSRPRSHYRRY